MSRTFGILLLVLGVWIGVEVYTEGVRHAFGGAFAFLGSESGEPGEPADLTERVSSATLEAQRRSEERRDRLIGE